MQKDKKWYRFQILSLKRAMNFIKIFDFLSRVFIKSQNSLPDVRVERACTRLFEIRPSNEVRIKLNENSELDKNGYRYVLANNAVKSPSLHTPIKPAYALRTKWELNESKNLRKMKRGIKLFAHRLFYFFCSTFLLNKEKRK